MHIGVCGVLLAMVATLIYFDESDPRNWDGRLSLSIPDTPGSKVYRPASVAEVKEAVKEVAARGSRLRATGSGHSWSDAAVPSAEPGSSRIDLSRLAGPLANPPGTDGEDIFTFAGGTTLAAILSHLSARGFALPNLPSVVEQTIAGATATGTHGTGVGSPSLAESVLAMELVDGTGSVRRVNTATDGDLLNAVRCHLGSLGIVTAVTLRAVKAYNVVEEQTPMPFSDFVDSLESIVRGSEHVKAWFEPHSGTAMVFRQNKTSEPVDDTFFTLPLLEAKTFALEIVQQVTKFVPSTIPPVFDHLFNNLGGWQPSRRVGTPESVFRIPHRIAGHNEMEIVFPLSEAPAKLAALSEAILESGIPVGHILEIRFAAPDKQWISMGYGEEPHCYVTLCILNERDGEDVENYFRIGEKTLAGRPHWAKVFYARGKEVTKFYPKWNDWNSLRKKWDPKGVFVNAFVERLISDDADRA